MYLVAASIAAKNWVSCSSTPAGDVHAILRRRERPDLDRRCVARVGAVVVVAAARTGDRAGLGEDRRERRPGDDAGDGALAVVDAGRDPAGLGQAGRFGRGERHADLAVGRLELERAGADGVRGDPSHDRHERSLDDGLGRSAGLLGRRERPDRERVSGDHVAPRVVVAARVARHRAVGERRGRADRRRDGNVGAVRAEVRGQPPEWSLEARAGRCRAPRGGRPGRRPRRPRLAGGGRAGDQRDRRTQDDGGSDHAGKASYRHVQPLDAGAGGSPQTVAGADSRVVDVPTTFGTPQSSSIWRVLSR